MNGITGILWHPWGTGFRTLLTSTHTPYTLTSHPCCLFLQIPKSMDAPASDKHTHKSLVQLALHTRLLHSLVGRIWDSMLAAYLWCLQAVLSQAGRRMRLGNDPDTLTIPGFSGVPQIPRDHSQIRSKGSRREQKLGKQPSPFFFCVVLTIIRLRSRNLSTGSVDQCNTTWMVERHFSEHKIRPILKACCNNSRFGQAWGLGGAKVGRMAKWELLSHVQVALICFDSALRTISLFVWPLSIPLLFSVPTNLPLEVPRPLAQQLVHCRFSVGEGLCRRQRDSAPRKG